MEDDTIRIYYQKEYFPWRCIDLIERFLRFKKDINSYEDFVNIFMGIDLDFIEKYLLISYKETFLARLYFIFYCSEDVQQYRNFWKIQKWQENS